MTNDVKRMVFEIDQAIDSMKEILNNVGRLSDNEIIEKTVEEKQVIEILNLKMMKEIERLHENRKKLIAPKVRVKDKAKERLIKNLEMQLVAQAPVVYIFLEQKYLQDSWKYSLEKDETVTVNSECGLEMTLSFEDLEVVPENIEEGGQDER